jgi:mandelamide amidase
MTSARFRPRTIADFRADIADRGREAVARAVLSDVEAHADENVFIDFDAAPYLAGLTGDGPLGGVPFVVKDNIDALPFRTSGGSPAIDRQPAEDAPVVARLRAAGGVVLGKANLHELAFGVTSNNAHYGPVRNPFDTRRVAGGSSGGTALAVALGLVPFGLGTDTGGSVRIPAAFCGIAGFRPSTGRYPSDGVLVLSPTRDTIGVMAANVGDVELVDGIISGEAVEPPPERLRLGVLKRALAGLSRDVDGALDRALRRLAAAGIDLVPIDPTPMHDLESRIEGPVAICEIAEVWRRHAAERGLSLEAFGDRLGSNDVRLAFVNLEAASAAMAEAYRFAMGSGRRALQTLCSDLFAGERLDALLTATVPVPPPLIGEDETMIVDGAELPTFATIIRNASLAPVAGLPSLSVPAGFGEDGLPVGLQIEGEAGRDRRLLAIGRVVEAVLGGAGSAPE